MRPYEPDQFITLPWSGGLVATSDLVPADGLASDWRREWTQPQEVRDVPGAPEEGRRRSRWDIGPMDDDGAVAAAGQRQRQWQGPGTPPPSPPSPSLLSVSWMEPPPVEHRFPEPLPPPSFPLLAPFPALTMPPPPSFAPPLPPTMDEEGSRFRAAEWAPGVTLPSTAAAWRQEEAQLETAGPAYPFRRSVQELQSAVTWSEAGRGMLRHDGWPMVGETTGVALTRQDLPNRRFYDGPMLRPADDGRRTATERRDERPRREVRI